MENKVAICILVRNCEKYIGNLVDRINRLSYQFEDSQLFFVENNSIDLSKSKLMEVKNENEKVIIDSFDDPKLDNLDRIERMTILRNRCLNLVKTQHNWEPDYLILVDGDVEFNPDNIGTVISLAPKDWTSLTANGRYFLSILGLRIHVLYYDLFALVPIDCDNPMMTEKQMLANRWKVQSRLKSEKCICCKSAFGGIGIYRYSSIENNMYTP